MKQKIYFIIAIIAFSLTNSLYANSTHKQAYLQWVPVEGATAYYIELKNETGDIIVTQKTTANKITLSLKYGTYEYRIGIISKFNKIFTWSPWYTLVIVPPILGDYYVNHLLGVGIGYNMQIFEDSTVYTSSIASGAFYECHGFLSFLSNIFAGTSINTQYFFDESGDFKASWMIKGGLYIGYDFPAYTRGSKAFFNISPFLGYLHYYRVHTFEGKKYTASRPIFLAGASFNFNISKNLLIGINCEYNRIFDNHQINTFTLYGRVGFWL